jgi:hypothetical protein
MSLEPIKIWELVDRAVLHKWSIPEFQRGFVWKATQVRDLAESLWLDYPVGSLLVWNSHQPQETKIAKDGVGPSQWIVDGQQRTTALAILFGRKPYWWSSADDWNKTLKRYDIRFDIAAKEAPYFLVANAAIRRAKGDRYVSLQRLLVLDINKDADQQKLMGLAKEIKIQGLCDGMDAMEVYTRLDRVRKIRDKDVMSVTVNHELEDVVEIFSRLNSRGTRVTEADIYLGIVASKSPGWVRDEFLPFIDVLAEAGFDIAPNLLFRTLTAVGIGKTRFREIGDDFWEPSRVKDAWAQVQKAWKKTIHRLQQFGILSTDPLPTQAALVTAVALTSRFDAEDRFEAAFYWFVQASRFGRYSGSGTTSLDEDLKDVWGASTLIEAVEKLLRRIPVSQSVSPDDFLRDYTDGRFWRFFLYLLVWRNKAMDWDPSGGRLGFHAAELLSEFKPQWHHIYPKKFLKGHVNEALIDALANIAVIGPEINIRISAKDPMKYLDKYKITDAKLQQQFIEQSRADFSIDRYGGFLRQRAHSLAAAANGVLLDLSEGLTPAARPRPNAIAAEAVDA